MWAQAYTSAPGTAAGSTTEPGLGADHARRAQVRRGSDRGGELPGELPEPGVRAAPVINENSGHVPEQRGPAVAQHHLVAVGQPNSSVSPARTAPTRFLTGAWRWEVPSSAVPLAARCCTDWGRTLAGPSRIGRRRGAGQREWRLVTTADCATLETDRVHDLSAERVDYLGDHLLESDGAGRAVMLFEAWLADAFAARDQGLLAEPTAMVVATCDGGRPSARTVLLKSVSRRRASSSSPTTTRARAPRSRPTPAVALHFGWYALHRQVRVEGTAAPGQPGGVGGLLPRPGRGARSSAPGPRRSQPGRRGSWPI